MSKSKTNNEERDVEDALGFRIINGKAVPYWDRRELSTDEQKDFDRMYKIGPEGLTIYHSTKHGKK
jgi:hypothetical protein